jgi:hypothetical protein
MQKGGPSKGGKDWWARSPEGNKKAAEALAAQKEKQRQRRENDFVTKDWIWGPNQRPYARGNTAAAIRILTNTPHIRREDLEQHWIIPMSECQIEGCEHWQHRKEADPGEPHWVFSWEQQERLSNTQTRMVLAIEGITTDPTHVHHKFIPMSECRVEGGCPEEGHWVDDKEQLEDKVLLFAESLRRAIVILAAVTDQDHREHNAYDHLCIDPKCKRHRGLEKFQKIIKGFAWLAKVADEAKEEMASDSEIYGQPRETATETSSENEEDHRQ